MREGFAFFLIAEVICTRLGIIDGLTTLLIYLSAWGVLVGFVGALGFALGKHN